ncbi:F-box protein [Acorus calamus]|uniref:F-box protein n=1 Tax=Acorus calamus TaxID=4465 RepID=A0AAV9C3U1_ACOCL|nr:F-box protein [Acorus calamus]
MAMGSINGVDLIEDLLIEILSHSPAKSICRFKCVSKAWYILISDKSNQKRFPHIFHGLFSQSYSMRYDITQSYVPLSQSNVNLDDAPQFNLDFLPFDQNVQIIDSRNGLILCRAFARQPASQPMTSYVCNPTMKTWVALSRQFNGTFISTLGFDPSISY